MGRSSGGRDRGTRAPVVVVLVVAAVLAPLRARAQPLVLPAAGRIVAIEVYTDSSTVDREEILEQTALDLGSTFDPARAARTLENLHALGLGTDLALEVRPAEGGLVVMLMLRVDFSVTSVELRGDLGLARTVLSAVVEQRAGAPLVEDRLVRSVFALVDRLRGAGYRDATVRLDVRPDAVGKTAAVAFDIAAGARVLVGEVGFAGELGGVSPAALRAALDLRSGAPAAADQIARQRELLRAYLVEQGFLAARVEAPRERYDQDEQRVDLTFEIAAGLNTDLRIEGVVYAERLRRLFFERLRGTAADATLLDDAVARLRRDLQERGHFGVRIERTDRRAGDGQLLLLSIVPGPRHVLREVSFRGNAAYPEKTLRALFETSARQALVPGSGRLVDAQLRADLDNLRSFYQLQGYSAVAVGPPQVVVEPGGGDDERTVRVWVEIEEGERQMVSGLRATGMNHLDLGGLPAAPLQAGGPFHPQRLEEQVRQLRALYEERGFERPVIETTLDWSADQRLVDVSLAVVEGPQTVIDRVIVRGNLRTRSAVVKRALGLNSGQPLSRSRLLEAQRRLYQLGVFAAAEVAPSARRVVPEEGVVRRDVIVRVEEGRRWRLQYGGSLDSEAGVGGLLAATYANPGGRGGSLRLDLRANQRDQRFRLLYTDRTSSLLRGALNYALYRIEEELSDFESERAGVQFEAVRTRGRLRGSAFFDYRDVAIESDSGELPEEVERELEEVRIASATATLIYDRRDDPLDPRRGAFGTLQLEQAVPFLGADERFTKLFVQAAAYLDFGRLGVLAASVRGGAIRPGDQDGDVPVSERFFAGGRTTHRAFERDLLGIPGETIVEGTAVGGNGLLLLNLDLRFPIAGAFGGSVFYDAGNVWADYRDVEFGEVRHGVGVGVRYLTPIGPIRLELGYRVDAEPGEDREVVLLSFGNPF